MMLITMRVIKGIINHNPSQNSRPLRCKLTVIGDEVSVTFLKVRLDFPIDFLFESGILV